MSLIAAILFTGCARQTMAEKLDGDDRHQPRLAFGDRPVVSIQRAVAPVLQSEFPTLRSGSPTDAPLRLVWVRTYFGSPQWSRPNLLVTCHGLDEIFGQVVRFYVAKDDRFEPLLEAVFREGFLQEPQLFTEGRHWFLFLRSHSGGSSTYYNYLLVWLGENDARQLAIERPVEVLADRVGKGQHSDPGRTAIVSAGYNGPLVFSFSIWNDGDLNNFPTGESVRGEFELQLDFGGRPEQFVVSHWTGPE